jgi:hypothetical protein
MKNTICTFAMMIGVSALATSGLMAQQLNEKGTIPFDFQVAGKTVPAGTYAVYRETTGSGAPMIWIRSLETRLTLYTPVASAKAGSAGQPKLVFRKYGDRYFLAEVWFAEESVGHVYPVSKPEKELATAMNNKTPEVTYIAMR